jgi:hypothetical protein
VVKEQVELYGTLTGETGEMPAVPADEPQPAAADVVPMPTRPRRERRAGP